MNGKWVICVVLAALALVLSGPLAKEGRADFTLWDGEQLSVTAYHSQGMLYDESRVWIVSGGRIGGAIRAHDTSTVDISGGSVSDLYAYETSTISISSGNELTNVAVSVLYAYNTSIVNMSGGLVPGGLNAFNSSVVNISGGSVGVYACDTSSVNISGGEVFAYACGTSTVDISGGSMAYLYANDTSNVTFIVQNFRLGDGLSLDGDRVRGTGFLSGEWYDGTRWTVDIKGNSADATILVTTPDPTDPVPPSADAGGPYTICAGDPLILSADHSTEGDSPIVSYLWDLDGDDVFETDAGDQGFLELGYDYVESLGLNAGAIYDIDLKVTDSEGLFDTASAILRIFPDPAEFGDSNIDGVVDEADLANLVAQFGGPPDANSADFNGDGWVDLADFAIMRGNFGAVLVSAPDAEFGATTPEPATLSLLALGGLAVLRKRRRAGVSSQ